MTSKTANKFSPEVRARAVQLVVDHEHEHASRWSAIVSIASKIGCTSQTLNEWVKKAERDSGHKPGLTSDIATRLKALQHANRGYAQALAGGAVRLTVRLAALGSILMWLSVLVAGRWIGFV